jgi:hypothetical protein
MGTATDELKLDIAIKPLVDVIDITKDQQGIQRTQVLSVTVPSRTEVSLEFAVKIEYQISKMKEDMAHPFSHAQNTRGEIKILEDFIKNNLTLYIMQVKTIKKIISKK